MLKAVLFDLDGTLIDTAKDMAGALNRLTQEENLAAVDYDLIRSEVSHGARAMISLVCADDETSERFQQLRQRYLDIYQNNIAKETKLFPYMAEILALLEDRNIPWGIVTNKPSWLTLPLLEAMQLKQRAATIICADTAGVSKPDAKPILDACEELSIQAQDAIYVGDDERDVQAAHAAHMPAIAVRYGYIRQGQNPDNWQADYVLDTTQDVHAWISDRLAAAA